MKDRDSVDDLDLENTAIVLGGQGPQAVQRAEMDVASLCSIAQHMGPRDRAAMVRGAVGVGRAMGGMLRDDGSSVAYYAWEQGGKMISGPSIDLMEALADVWTRLVMSVEIVEETPRRVRLVASVMDLVTVKVTRRPFVSSITPAPGKFAKKPDQADRWVASQISSATSKAIRGVLEHTIPDWMQRPAIEAAKVAHAKVILGDASLTDTIKKAAAHLREKWGLDETALVAWLDAPRDAWTIEHVARLRSLATELKEGRRTIESVRAEAAAPQSPQAAEGDRLASVGLGGQRPAAQPQTAQAPAAAPAANSDPKPAASRPDAAAGAQLIRDALVTQARGSLVPMRAVREKHREALKMARIGDERHLAAVQYGADQGWWTVETDGIRVPGAPAADRWAPLLGEELAIATSDVMERLGDDLSGEACRAVGVSVDAFDSATDDELRRLGRELDRIEAQLRASEGA